MRTRGSAIDQMGEFASRGCFLGGHTIHQKNFHKF
uniref:Uncharacterized protein n=1 Tax=Arundo donax TaxID=35708 RepID=A0A0A9BFF0_ARUDO